MGRVTERTVNMTISTHKLYKKHMKTATCKGQALRLSMEELTDLYRDMPLNAEVYERYNTLKRRLYQNYTILPQIFIGIVVGLGSGIIASLIKNDFRQVIILGLFVVFYPAFASRAIFKSHILILKEYEISLIEEKIKQPKPSFRKAPNTQQTTI